MDKIINVPLDDETIAHAASPARRPGSGATI